jgi:hypothetical protein
VQITGYNKINNGNEVSGVKFMPNYPWARIYLFLLSSSRAFVLGFGMARDYRYYLPHLDMDFFMAFFAVLFLFHWIIVMFYQAVHKWAITAALTLNVVYTVFCRSFFIGGSRNLSLLEIVWYGSWITIAIDIVFIGLILYHLRSTKKVRGNII